MNRGSRIVIKSTRALQPGNSEHFPLEAKTDKEVGYLGLLLIGRGRGGEGKDTVEIEVTVAGEDSDEGCAHCLRQ